MIQRYDLERTEYGPDAMMPANHGEYVRYADIEPLRKWIHRAERLPDTYQDVLAYADDECFVAYVVDEMEANRWRSSFDDSEIEVTHWMTLPPLPEPTDAPGH
jgi:hypothetical protein